MTIIAVIPAFDEESTIGEVVTLAGAFAKVLVVDNLSSDKTREVARRAGASVISCPIKGAGAATRLGLSKALTMGATVVVTLDGDGQHDPNEIPSVVAPILANQAEVVIGSRFSGQYKAPRIRKLGIDVITFLLNAPSGRIKDGQSCFRAFRRDCIVSLLPQENGFGFSTEMLCRARKLNLRVVEVPIRCIYHAELKLNSTMNPVKQGMEVVFKTLKWRLLLGC